MIDVLGLGVRCFLLIALGNNFSGLKMASSLDWSIGCSIKCLAALWLLICTKEICVKDFYPCQRSDVYAVY